MRECRSERQRPIISRKKTERYALAPVRFTAVPWAFLAVAAMLADAGNLVLVRNGVPTSTIVIAAGTSQSAADDFQEYIPKISGEALHRHGACANPIPNSLPTS